MKTFLLACYEWILRTGGRRSALDFYLALRRWGRYSGIPQASDETPLEYGTRLACRFPKIRTDIMLIIEMLHWEIYGDCTLSKEQIGWIQEAWQKLHSPLRWPFRMRSLMKNS